jgi:hypothetical protein
MKNKLPYVKKAFKSKRKQDNWNFYNFAKDDFLGLLLALKSFIKLFKIKEEKVNSKKLYPLSDLEKSIFGSYYLEGFSDQQTIKMLKEKLDTMKTGDEAIFKYKDKAFSIFRHYK